jgi:hypothetical protein
VSRCEHFWVSYLAMTMAQAMKSEDPQKILRPVIQKFLREGASHTIRAQIYSVLKEGEKSGLR